MQPYIQQMIDWCSQPPPQNGSDTQALLCSLISPDSLPQDRTIYRGFLFYKPGGTLMKGHFFGTLFLSQAKQPAREFAKVVVAIRMPHENLTLSASYLSSIYDVEPMAPELQRQTPNALNNPVDAEGINVFAHGTSYAEDVFTLNLENGWFLNYVFRTVTPYGRRNL